MTKEEFLARVKEQKDWAPGWEAIDNEFDRLYKGQNPAHFGTNMVARAVFGGDQYLDGYSIYTSSKGYLHMVTYGMTELYLDEDLFGNEWNKWGYEMTLKLKEDDVNECMWAINVLANLARYTYTSQRFFEPHQTINGGGKALNGKDSAITALITIADTEAMPLDTIYGRTEFIQLFGITETEYQALVAAPDRIQELCEKVKKDNPDFVTDMGRTESYIRI